MSVFELKAKIEQSQRRLQVTIKMLQFVCSGMRAQTAYRYLLVRNQGLEMRLKKMRK
jgi:hypothetical protein